MKLQFTTLTNTNHTKFREVVSIYEDSFPANERQPLEIFEERVSAGKTELIVAEQNDQVMGFVVIWDFNSMANGFIDYLAVSSKFRSKGIGRQLLKFVCQKARSSGKDLIIETEYPGEGENMAERERRLQFYLNNGAFILGQVPYILPSLNNTSNTKMLLLVIPAENRQAYPGTEIKKLIKLIYSEVYQKPADDKLMLSFINQIPETAFLTKLFKS